MADSRTNRFASYLWGFLLLLMLLSIWELAANIWLVGFPYIPSPTQIVSSFIVLQHSGELALALGTTLPNALLGLLFSFGLAIPIGIVVGRSARIQALSFPLIEFLRPIPSSALIPLALLLFGIGTSMRIAVIVFGTFWPLLISTIQGSSRIPRQWLDVAQLCSLSGVSLFWRVLFPATLPFIVAGLRISLAISLILAITAEMLIGFGGIGGYIIEYERSFKYPEMYALILAAGLSGIVLNGILSLLDKWLVGWGYSSSL
jgi:sulfonate transport system permease protein